MHDLLGTKSSSDSSATPSPCTSKPTSRSCPPISCLMEYHHNFKPTSHPAITTCHFTSLKPCRRIRLRTSMPSSCVATKAWLAPYSVTLLLGQHASRCHLRGRNALSSHVIVQTYARPLPRRSPCAIVSPPNSPHRTALSGRRQTSPWTERFGLGRSPRSTSGWQFTYSMAIISWGSKKQISVALSSCEAEIMAASEAAKEAQGSS